LCITLREEGKHERTKGQKRKMVSQRKGASTPAAGASAVRCVPLQRHAEGGARPRRRRGGPGRDGRRGVRMRVQLWQRVR
jgi:hypothetical protein